MSDRSKLKVVRLQVLLLLQLLLTTTRTTPTTTTYKVFYIYIYICYCMLRTIHIQECFVSILHSLHVLYFDLVGNSRTYVTKTTHCKNKNEEKEER